MSNPRKWRFGLKSLLVLVAVAAVMTWVATRGYWLLMGHSGSGFSADAANYAVSARLTLPASASDVNFYTDLCWLELDCSLPEQDFLAWCRAQSWSVRPIETSASFGPARTSPEGSRVVVRGYTFTAPTGSGVYDAVAQSVCLRFYNC